MKATDLSPRDASGAIDADRWLAAVCSREGIDGDLLRRALSVIAGIPGRSAEFLDKGVELANLVLSLNMDVQSLAAALLYRPLRTRSIDAGLIADQLGPQVATLVESVVRTADTSLLEMSNSKMQTSESRDQVENVKRMLVSMIDDPRVAVLKLAERVMALRAAKGSTEERRRRIAQEAHLVFAPLANRLGVWQLKWELEDLALRYLAPEVYRALAKQLDGRRAEREAEVANIVELVEARLRANGISATVSGRAKHIYSIWRKMRAKNVGIGEVYDVRAIRVLVPDIAQCYSTLGVIHTQWQHLPSEFDDYVAVPKENGYRSIHTAVRWDDGKTLEIQIRTPEMHEESELGVCAHWAYKDGVAEDVSFNQKMDWMRHVVDWQEESEDWARRSPISLQLEKSIREERIFVYTPKGHVLDLTRGATPLDFAYRVHTAVGHRCRGAKVDGKQVALNTPLESGQRVEILSGDIEAPERSWLDEHLGMVRTGRAQEKIREWFHGQTPDQAARLGKRLLADTLTRLGLPAVEDGEGLAAELGYSSSEAFYVALGVGDCQTLDALEKITGTEPVPVLSGPAQMSLLGEDAIPNEGGSGSAGTHFYTLEVVADDRAGLLMDISAYLNRHDVTLLSNSGRTDLASERAVIELGVRLENVVALARILDGLLQIPSVTATRRLS